MNRLWQLLSKTGLALSCMAVLFACTTPKPATIDTQLVTQEGFEQIQEGLKIYIRPLRDKTEIKRYFGANLLDKDILPIFVSAENKSESKYFLVEPADLYQQNRGEYMTAKEAKNTVYEKDTQLERGMIVAGPIFWLVAIPMAMSDYGPTDASKSLQQAMITKALRKQTLTPGKKESGFIYYHIPPEMLSAEKVGINLKATELDSLDVIFFRFTKEMSAEGKDENK